MERKIITTKDGSHSISVPELKVAFHSIYGAIQESMHVYIDAGLRRITSPEENLQSIKPDKEITCLRIFEMGFGTGLNALLTLIETEKLQLQIHYTAIELYPLNNEETSILNYCEQLNRAELQPVFEQLHQCEWEKDIPLTNYFSIRKSRTDLLNFQTTETFELVYFDAFAPMAQPELWTKEVFEKIYAMLAAGGVLVTYCCKGEVRRNMLAAGLDVKKIPGPPGKREMLRAIKPVN